MGRNPRAGFTLLELMMAIALIGLVLAIAIPSFGTFTRMSVQVWVYREGATNTRESLISYKEGDSPNCGFLLSLNEDGASQRPRMYVQVNGGWQFAGLILWNSEGQGANTFGRLRM